MAPEKKKNASPASLRAGWRHYLTSDGHMPLEAINRALVVDGFDAVSDRAMQHYSRLRRAGYTLYVSMNRLDVALSADRTSQFAASPRYEFHHSDSAATATFAIRNSIARASGRLQSIGESGGVIRFFGDESDTLKIRKPTEGDMFSVDLVGSGRRTEARIIGVEFGPRFVDVEFEFARLQSIASVLDLRESRTRVGLTLEVRLDEVVDDSLDVLGRQIFYVFELIEVARAAANVIALASTDREFIEVPEVKSLVRRSPLQATLVVAPLLASVLEVMVRAIAPLKQWETWRSHRLDNNRKAVGLTVDQANAQLDIAKAGLKLELVQLATKRVRDASTASDMLERSVSAAISPILGLLDQGVSTLLLNDIDLRELENAVDVRDKALGSGEPAGATSRPPGAAEESS